MRLHVRHQTAYRYSEPIVYAIQSLRLTPQQHEGLIVMNWRIYGEARRDQALPSYVDGYGNIVHCHTVNRRHQSAVVTVEGEVETRLGDGVVRGAPEPLPPVFFLRRTSLTAPDAAIEDIAGVARGPGRVFDRMEALMQAVRDRLDYRPGITDSATPASEALAAGAGVCQDHAHVFIAAARLVGVPARYVGGYLWAGPVGDENQASHAWAEAYIDDFGWVGFDPSNRTQPTEAYIRISVGLDYWSAAPVRGVRRGQAEESLAVSVHVRDQRQDQQ